MIGNKLEQSIISVFQNNLSATFSINEISKILKKSYPNINMKSNYFLKEGVLKKIDIGRSYRCYLNIENEKAKIFMTINELNAREELLQKKPELSKVEPTIMGVLMKNPAKIAMISGKRVIIVAENTNQFHNYTKNMLPAGYSISITDVESFKKEFLENKDMQANHLILSNINDYLEIISDLNEKLLMKGLLGKNEK